MKSYHKPLGVARAGHWPPVQWGNITPCLILWLAGAVTGTHGLAEEAPLRALIMSGQNNHDWRQTTPKLKSVLAATGRFAVEITEHPEQCDATYLAHYDVILSDWNTFGSPAVTNWPETAREALLTFVRGGKGFVVVHAGGSSFYDWPEYQQLAGASWKMGQTSHGPSHAFTVAMVADHPIVRGLPPFQTTDELWIRPGTDPKALVLASGEDQPIALAGQFGQGRSFTLLLGHSAEFMDTPGFQLLLGRGVEWAATGKATLRAAAASDADGLLKELAAYHFGDNRSVVLRLERLAASLAADTPAKANLARKLGALLFDSMASVESRRIACWQLSLVGSADEVPALTRFISDADLGYYARLALERIPGNVADAALREALHTAAGDARRSVINSLAARRSKAAVADLATLMDQEDAATAGAAMDGLAAIGGTEAAAALMAHKDSVAAALQARYSGALLRCAEALAAAGQNAPATVILERLTSASQPSLIRLAAFPVYVKVLGVKGGDILQSYVSSKDPRMQEAAIRALRANPTISLAQQAAQHLEEFADDLQAQCLALLGEIGDRSFIPGLTQAVSSPNAAVRQAALTALGLAGDASVIPLLASRTAQGEEEEKKLIAEALVRLRGDDVDAALIAALKTAVGAAQPELIRALVSRGVKPAVPVLLELAQAGDAAVRSRAIGAVGKLGDSSACDSLVSLLNNGPDAAASAIAEICRRENSVQPMLAALTKTNPAGKAPLLEALASIGGTPALEAARGALKAGDEISSTAALRAMANWPDAAPLSDLFSVASTATDAKLKILALRGIARLAPLATDIPSAKAVEMLTKAIDLQGPASEQKQLLAAMSEIPGEATLKALKGYLNHPGLAVEAKAAIEQYQNRHAGSSVPWDEEAVKIFLSPENLCRGAGATNLDGLFPDGQGQGAFAAIDGDPRTYWDETDQRSLYWLQIRLARPATVACLRLLGFQHHNYAPKQFEVLCDGKLVKRVENAEYENNLLTVDWPPTESRTVELKITGYYGQSPAIRELGLYTQPSAKH